MENFKLNHRFIDVNSRLVTTETQESSEPVLLSQKEMELLLYLCHRPNQVITSEELIAHIWPDQQHQNDSLLDAMIKLKNTFAADQFTPACIETMPHIGYRLLVTPEPDQVPQSQQGSINAFALERNKPQWRHSLFSSAGLFALVVFMSMIAALAVIGLSYDEQPTKVSSYRNNHGAKAQNIAQVAVIPLTNNSENSDDNYLGDGIAQALINSMADLPNINVVAHHSSSHYRGQRLNPYQIGSRLNAKYVLKGSVKRDKQQISVTMQLLWVKSNIEVWSKTYNQPYSELLLLQHRLFIDISKQLKLALPAHAKQPNQTQLTDNRFGKQQIEAYQSFLLGQALSDHRSSTVLTKAIRHYERAISIDPDFALAYAQMALVYLAKWELGYIGAKGAQQKIRSALDQAFLLTPNLPEAHLARGMLLARTRNSTQALNTFSHAIELRPNYALAHLYLGIELQHQLRFNEAEPAIAEAIKLDPNNRLAQQYGAQNQLSLGELDQGISYLLKTMEKSATHSKVELALSRWYREYGYLDKASQWATVALGKDILDPKAHIAMANSAANKAQMHDHLDKAQGLAPIKDKDFAAIARVYYQHGDMVGLRQFVQQHLYTQSGALDHNKTVSALIWAGVIKVSNNQYQAAVKIFEQLLAQYQNRGHEPMLQIKLTNMLAYCYKKLGDSEQVNNKLKRSKRVQTDLIRNGLKTPAFVIEMVAYYLIANEQRKAEQLLRNAMAKGWKLNHYIKNNPIFELLSARQQYIIQ